MSKKFKAKHMKKLDNPIRREILPPDKVLEIVNIKEGQCIADIGCGTGYFTIPLAKVVAEKGKIFAIDINTEMLDETKSKVEKEEISNVVIVKSSENNFNISDESTDIVFTSTVFHEIHSPELFLKESKRVLTNKGSIVILDWNKVEEEMGPPFHKRKDVNEVKDDLIMNGFSIAKEEYLGNSFYIIIAKKISLIKGELKNILKA